MNLPIVGATYTHKNSNQYRVLFLANLDSTRSEYPPTVIYLGLKENKVWAKNIDRFNSGMTLTNEESKNNAFIYQLSSDDRYPKSGELYKHHNDNEYTVLAVANIDVESSDYPVTIAYQGENGKIWSKSIDNFLTKMKKV